MSRAKGRPAGRAAALTACALGLSGLGLWWLGSGTGLQAGDRGEHGEPPLARRPAAAAPVDLLAAPAAGQPVGARRPVAELERRLFVEGSLRQAQLDGAWTLDGLGRLQPSLQLRRRFDQLLSTLGEASAAELGDLVRQRATAELGAAGAEQVMGIWQRYLQVLGHRYQRVLDGADPSSGLAALAERQQVRRQLLGMAWAEAFFSADEEALRQRLAATPGVARAEPQAAARGEETPGAGQLPALAQAPAAGADLDALQRQRRAAFGAEAAQRLLEEDQAQAAWAARLAQARAEMENLLAAAQLSQPQRDEAARRWLDDHFSGSERLRVRSLLGR